MTVSEAIKILQQREAEGLGNHAVVLLIDGTADFPAGPVDVTRIERVKGIGEHNEGDGDVILIY